MIILDEVKHEPLTGILLMLTPSEAKELLDKLETLSIESGEHIHIDDDNYSKELTIAIYTPENIKYFAKGIRELLEQEMF